MNYFVKKLKEFVLKYEIVISTIIMVLLILKGFVSGYDIDSGITGFLVGIMFATNWIDLASNNYKLIVKT